MKKIKKTSESFECQNYFRTKNMIKFYYHFFLNIIKFIKRKLTNEILYIFI